jgi:hypothetical protein
MGNLDWRRRRGSRRGRRRRRRKRRLWRRRRRTKPHRVVMEHLPTQGVPRFDASFFIDGCLARAVEVLEHVVDLVAQHLLRGGRGVPHRRVCAEA